MASIYGLEEADGALALALALVEGEDLAQRLTRGAIPVDEATSYARQLIDGLEAAHDPDPGRHRTHFYAHYANSVRG